MTSASTARRATGIVVGSALTAALAACTADAGDPERTTLSASRASSAAPGPSTSAAAGTPVVVTVDGREYPARLNGSAAARDLVSRLPLTVRFEERDELEKTATVSPGLDLTGAPAGSDPVPGEIGYYSPSRHLVLYNGDVDYFPGIVDLGRFEVDIDGIARLHDPFDATIAVAG
jgi:hypothetical protein